MTNETGYPRIVLACHILYEWVMRRADGITAEEIVQLRSYAETPEEQNMALDELARVIVHREQMRLGSPKTAKASAA